MVSPQDALAQIKANEQARPHQMVSPIVDQVYMAKLMDMKKASEGVGKQFKGAEKSAKETNQAMGQASGKGAAIQKIIAATFDFLSIGVLKLQKDFVGALKKGLAEGDIAGMIQGLIDVKAQFVNFDKLMEPIVTLFEPFNDMIQIIADFASAAIVQSPQYQEFMEQMLSPEGLEEMRQFGERLAGIALKFVNLDWEHMLTVVERVLDVLDTITNMMSLRPGNFSLGGGGGGGGAGNGFLWSPNGPINPEPVNPGGGVVLNMNVNGAMTENQLHGLMGWVQRQAARWHL